MYMYARTYTHTHTYTGKRTHTYTHARKYTRAHTHIYSNMCISSFNTSLGMSVANQSSSGMGDQPPLEANPCPQHSAARCCRTCPLHSRWHQILPAASPCSRGHSWQPKTRPVATRFKAVKPRENDHGRGELCENLVKFTWLGSRDRTSDVSFFFSCLFLSPCSCRRSRPPR